MLRVSTIRWPGAVEGSRGRGVHRHAGRQRDRARRDHVVERRRILRHQHRRIRRPLRGRPRRRASAVSSTTRRQTFIGAPLLTVSSLQSAGLQSCSLCALSRQTPRAYITPGRGDEPAGRLSLRCRAGGPADQRARHRPVVDPAQERVRPARSRGRVAEQRRHAARASQGARRPRPADRRRGGRVQATGGAPLRRGRRQRLRRRRRHLPGAARQPGPATPTPTRPTARTAWSIWRSTTGRRSSSTGPTGACRP